MQVALSCLDNQFARTTLNRGCNDRGVTMVNGGCGVLLNLVEAFSERAAWFALTVPKRLFFRADLLSRGRHEAG